MRYIFFTFSFIFFSGKKVFSVKNLFRYKTFFPYKFFFSANNAYFVKIKNTNIFSKKKSFFQLSVATNEQPYLFNTLVSLITG